MMNFYRFKLLIAVLLFSSCFGIKPVEIVGIKNFKSVNTLSSPEFQFEVLVKNPNNFGVKITRVDLSLFNGSTELVQTNLHSKVKIKKGELSTLPINLKPSVNAINLLLKTEMNNLVRGKVTSQLELKGHLTFKKFLFSRKIKIKEPIKL